MIAHRVRPDGLHEQREEAEQEPTLQNKCREFPGRGFVFHPPRQRERKRRAHGEQKKGKDQIHPRDAGQRADPFKMGRRLLRVIHPARQRVLIEGKLAGQQHRQDGQPAQRVERERAAGGSGAGIFGGHVAKPAPDRLKPCRIFSALRSCARWWRAVLCSTRVRRHTIACRQWSRRSQTPPPS